MGKVASFAWYRAIGEAMPERKVLHIHEVNPRSLAITRDLVAAKGNEQTIANAVSVAHASSATRRRWSGGLFRTARLSRS